MTRVPSPSRASGLWFGLSLLLVATADPAIAQPIATARPRLRVEGRHFVDPAGRVVTLRGINLAGNSKVPPFVPITDARTLDPLPALGFNVVRLVFTWEAYEPGPGRYDRSYLDRMRWIASECASRGLYVIVDIHQDGFSRYLSRGSGDGFPPWAISPRARLHAPDNGPDAKDWPIRMATDAGMHRSFADFYSDKNGVRTRYLLMLASVARGFADVPGVVGYDLMNEPWGDERAELAPLYADAEHVIRAEDPSAILFIEGRVTTNIGLQTCLPRPSFGNVAYSPHYYKPSAIIRSGWKGRTTMIDLAFSHMRTTAEAWDCPLFLGEFGVPATSDRGLDYVTYLYDRLDDDLSSGAQWNYTPGWTPQTRTAGTGRISTSWASRANSGRTSARVPIHETSRGSRSPSVAKETPSNSPGSRVRNAVRRRYSCPPRCSSQGLGSRSPRQMQRSGTTRFVRSWSSRRIGRGRRR